MQINFSLRNEFIDLIRILTKCSTSQRWSLTDKSTCQKVHSACYHSFLDSWKSNAGEIFLNDPIYSWYKHLTVSIHQVVFSPFYGCSLTWWPSLPASRSKLDSILYSSYSSDTCYYSYSIYSTQYFYFFYMTLHTFFTLTLLTLNLIQFTHLFKKNSLLLNNKFLATWLPY